MKDKRIFLLPAKFMELLWTDQDFFSEVSKLKKVVANTNNFPRHDQWLDENGMMRMTFALAGYSEEDVKISISNKMLTISSEGIDNVIKPVQELENVNLDEKNIKIHQGLISRGIARRSFILKYIVADEFDLSMIKASMKNGLLNLTIPHSENEFKVTEIKIAKE